MLDKLAEWKPLKDSKIGEVFLLLTGEERKLQIKAYDALDYTLLSINADRPENYGDPKILLENASLFDAIPVLVKIAALEEFNDLAKYYALNLLWDIYNFANGEDEKKYSPEKTQVLRQTIASEIAIYEALLNHPHQDVRIYAERLIKLLRF